MECLNIRCGLAGMSLIVGVRMEDSNPRPSVQEEALRTLIELDWRLFIIQGTRFIA